MTTTTTTTSSVTIKAVHTELSTAPPEDSFAIVAVTGYRFDVLRECAYWCVAVCTGFLSCLLAFWFPVPAIRLRYVHDPDYSHCDYVLVTTRNRQSEFVPIEPVAAQPESEQPTTFGRYNGQRSSTRLTPNDQKMFVFRHMRYRYSEDTNSWHAVGVSPCYTASELSEVVPVGLSIKAAADRIRTLGSNVINIIVPSIPVLLVKEVFHPFIVFQMYSVILWGFEEYYYFASCIVVIAAVSIAMTLMETRSRLMSLSELAKHVSEVHVLRGGQWKTASSSDLVPGDIIDVSVGVVPCDACLVRGSAVVNESMLTGESLPIVKAAIEIPRTGSSIVDISSSSHMLYSATSVMQIKPASPDEQVVAIVQRTGFGTTKGALILSILYPQPSTFRFVEQSYKFIGCLFVIALIGFALSIWQLDRVGAEPRTMVIRALDLITIVVPPSLPLALSVGVNFALIALRKQKIFCIGPSRINMAGKIRLMCFDKTGTLTSEGMDLMGVLPSANGTFTSFQISVSRVTHASSDDGAADDPVSRQSTAIDVDVGASADDDGQFVNTTASDAFDDSALPASSSSASNLHRNGTSSSSSSPSSPAASRKKHRARSADSPDTLTSSSSSSSPSPSVSDDLLTAMACCHGLSTLNSSLVGDPLEVKIYNATDATMRDTGVLNGYQSIITVPLGAGRTVRFGLRHVFEFLSALSRMSVIAVNQEDDSIHAFVKGAPETIHALCRPETVPANFHASFIRYASQGYRILAIAHKRMTSVPDMDKRELRTLVEKDLHLLGLIVLENKVKPETAPTLEVLSRANVRSVMVTGDFPVTAVTVAKECGLVPRGTRVFIGKYDERDRHVHWHDSDDATLELDPLSLRPLRPLGASEVGGGSAGGGASAAGGDLAPYELAVSGDVYRRLESDPHARLPNSLFHRVVLSAQVFARMTPDQKASLVNTFQELGIYTGMCGDGANDCGALKAAHIGVSLSESEASIAAPFTYQRPNISCIPVLLSEGRSSLATSFSLFKYMGMYSLIQFGAVTLTYFRGSVLGNWQYLYQDLLVVFPLTILMGYTFAQPRLSIKRPSGDLLSLVNLCNVGMHVAICLAFQIIVFFVAIAQSDYVAYEDAEDFDNGPRTYVATSLYYFSNFQYVIMALLFARGAPWKMPVWTNRRFTLWAIAAILVSLLLLFSNNVSTFFTSDEVPVQSSWRGIIFALVLANTFTSCVWELLVYPLVVQHVARARKAQAGTLGTVFGVTKTIDGAGAKEYHRLRGEFEQGWRRG